VTKPRHTVHIRINDAATGLPTAARICFATPDGKNLAPLGLPQDFDDGPWARVQGGQLISGGKTFAYIDGSCEIQLPAGRLSLEVSKGPEYLPLSDHVMLGASKIGLRFALRRLTNFRQEGWYSGDTAVFLITPHAALLEAAAEDVAVANLLIFESSLPCTGTADRHKTAVLNMPAFSGQEPALQRPGHMVVVNTHNRHQQLGSLALLNCHRPVFPLRAGEPPNLESWTLADWCDQCHRKNGLVIWMRNQAWPEDNNARYEEALAELILGRIDGYDPGLHNFDENASGDWYRLLNIGLRIPLAAGSSKADLHTPVGNARTYAHIDSGLDFSYHSWIEAVRAGRSFVTLGPLLRFEVNNAGPGSVLALELSTTKVVVRAEAKAVESFDRLEIVMNGEVIASAQVSDNCAALEIECDGARAKWMAARCLGTGPNFPVLAHSSAIYLEVNGRSRKVDVADIEILCSRLQQSCEWVQSQSGCASETQRARLIRIFEQAHGKVRGLAND
jgi:hypothetical protein